MGGRSLEIEHRSDGRTHRITLRGQLDENADLNPLAKDVSGAATIDLSAVSFVNSLGLRVWIRFLLALSDKDTEVTLVRCSEAMVHQMNMVVAAQAGANIESFYVPYDCPSCGYSASLCVDVAPNIERLRKLEIPPQPCPECTKPMECGELADRYLLFLELND